jgi:hypothetical protein
MTSAAWVDYDNDGRLDLIVARYMQWDFDDIFCGNPEKQGFRSYCHPDLFKPESVLLFHNDGGGKFTEVSHRAGIEKPGKGLGVAIADYDRDGWMDILLANDAMQQYLFHNRGDGTFEDVTKKAHIDQTNGHYGLSVSTLDFDDDGWPDIFVACDSTPSILYHNNHDGTFTDVAVLAGAAFNEDGMEQAGMGSTVGDFNGDGHLDIFKTNFSDDTATLYANRGDGAFDDATFAAGLGLNTKYLGWGTMFFDLDNDGWPDLILANGHVYPEVDSEHLGSDYHEPRILYHNGGNGKFTDISATAGPGITEPKASRGLAIGDLWNDGKLSAVVTNMDAAPGLLVNQVRNGNHWVGVETKGTKSNGDGIGARIRMKVGKRILIDEVRSGSSYISNSDRRVHFGLGALNKIDWIEIRWPSGLTETFEAPKVDAILKLTEGTGKPAQLADR